MSEARDIYSGRTLKSADRRWNEIEHDLTLLENRKKKFYAWVEKFQIPYKSLVLDDIDNWNDQIRRLTEEQSHLEMFLIENEAPGWTST
jgi:hypothetical protein